LVVSLSQDAALLRLSLLLRLLPLRAFCVSALRVCVCVCVRVRVCASASECLHASVEREERKVLRGPTIIVCGPSLTLPEMS
jgi:hypothetical protein